MRTFNGSNITLKSKNESELDSNELMPLFKFVIFMAMFIVLPWTNGYLKIYLLLYREKISILKYKFFKNYW